MVRRIFTEKKDGFNIEAKGILSDIAGTLGITGIEDLRVFKRYDIEGIGEEDFEYSKKTIFSEPNVDIVYEGSLPPLDGYRVFTYDYLPGQYDQRADSAAQCVEIVTMSARPVVQSATAIAIKGDISDMEFDKIIKYMINPVEARIASEKIPTTLKANLGTPDIPETVNGFTKMSDAEIKEYHSANGFAMTADDLVFCRDYFQKEGRDPYITELKVIDTYWSDHCRHTTFQTELTEITTECGSDGCAVRGAVKQYYDARKEVYGENTTRPVTLMDIATMGMRLLKKRGLLKGLDESDEINACSVEIPVNIGGKEETWLLQFKNETHNHPTEIEPFGGAATCLGGAIRDPLSGRAYVYQAMRVTGSGDPTKPFEQTLSGKLPQKKITTGAADGYSSYGNQIGLATGQVTELYDDGYVAKRLEIGAVIGASPKANVKRMKPEEGDIIILLGGRTGRDGCGGATGSSKAHDISSIEECGAEVQKGNAPTERKLQRLFRNSEASSLIKKCNDFGAGGVCVAIGELADSLDINLDKVPKKYEGLNGTELAISESQERMAVVLSPKDVERFIELADRENLEATPVAVVTETGRLKMTFKDTVIVDISRDFLNTNGVRQSAKAHIAKPQGEKYMLSVPDELKDIAPGKAFVKNLGRLQVCSGKGLSEQFDSTVGASTVLMPFGGKYQLTPEEAMVAKLPVLDGETDTVSVMSYGFIPGISKWSPFHGAVYAVIESLCKLSAAGADIDKSYLTFQEYFERLFNDPDRWGKPAAALLGALSAQIGMGIASIGGKDSMSGTFGDMDVPPTLVSFAVASAKAADISSAAFKSTDSDVMLIKLPMAGHALPDFAKTKGLLHKISQYVKSKKFTAVGVVKEGGAAALIAKMAFGNKLGAEILLENPTDLYAPQCAFIVELAHDVSPETIMSEFDTAVKAAATNDSGCFTVCGEKVPLETALKAYESTLKDVFRIEPETKAKMSPEIKLYDKRSSVSPAIKTARPRVLIPAFPGTNGEYDAAMAFERAGAEAEIFVVRNLTPQHIMESVKEMAALIDKSQIIMLPGGFSAGDEPDGSGKFIATTFRNPIVKDAVHNLLKNRDGLMLGICNGFQALIKLGLVPYGEIREISENDPTLTFNTLGRHVSCMVRTRVTSLKSPWMSAYNVGDILNVPVSHGEGRFVAPDDVIAALAENGQIAKQYVDMDGNPTGDVRFNPNGSTCAVESITSPDGRVLGKMGHSERYSEHCFKNIPGEFDYKIIESGVKYFK